MHRDRSTRSRIQVRGSRDRLIDLLGLGLTYPLQDPEVDDSKLKVPYEDVAHVPVDPGQEDVEFVLHTRNETSVEGAESVPGTGELTLLKTPPITEGVTYKIYAKKIESGLATHLHETAKVVVGLDVILNARIHAPLLEPEAENPVDTAPRIIDFREIAHDSR